MRTAFASLVFVLAAGVGPAAAQLAPPDRPVFVTINGVALDPTEEVADSTTTTPRPRERDIDGRRALVVEGTFGIYTIGRCAGCPGPARLVIEDGQRTTGVNLLVLTDVLVRARPQATAAQLEAGLTIVFDASFDPYFGGVYPHGVVMDGSFGCRGSGRCIVPADNRISVSAFGGHSQAQELVKPGGGTAEPSLGFRVSRTRSFARQGIEEIPCTDTLECLPVGSLKVVVSLGAGGDEVSLPGSIAQLAATFEGEAGLARLIPAMNALLASPATAGGGVCGGSTPCACGDTVVASRTLDGDPVVTSICPGDGLVIGKSDVVLTIKGGHTIRGSGEGTGILLGAGVRGVTVRSGGVAGFGTGVRASGNDGNVFASLLVSGNVDAGLEVIGNDNTVDLVLAEANGAGIVVDGDRNAVTNSRIRVNDAGMTVTGSRNTVSRNVVERSAGPGVMVDGTAALVERNQISASGEDGLTVAGSGHVVSRNVVKLSGGAGLAVPSGQGMTLGRNTTDRSGGAGIRDATTGAGTGGTANVYTQNVCDNAALGDSSPARLCI